MFHGFHEQLHHVERLTDGAAQANTVRARSAAVAMPRPRAAGSVQ